MSTTPDLAGVRARHKRASEATNATLRALTSTNRDWQISIPRRTDDTDALIHASLVDVPVLADAVETLSAALAARETEALDLRDDLMETLDRNIFLAQQLAAAADAEKLAAAIGAARLYVAVIRQHWGIFQTALGKEPA